MGLFDMLRCEYPLPEAAHQGLEFQAKDLECSMQTYTITRDGRHIHHPRELFVRFTHGRVEELRRLAREGDGEPRG